MLSLGAPGHADDDDDDEEDAFDDWDLKVCCSWVRHWAILLQLLCRRVEPSNQYHCDDDDHRHHSYLLISSSSSSSSSSSDKAGPDPDHT